MMNAAEDFFVRARIDNHVTTTISPTALQSGVYLAGQAPLPSWNEGSAKKSIIKFVRGVTTTGGAHFVRPEERIAVFDNDGTLWSEMPAYFQLAFVFDRLKALAPQHPEWIDKPLYAAILEGDMKTVAAGGLHGLLEIAMITHAGMTTDEFSTIGGVDCNSQASKIQPSIHRTDLPADVGTACLFAGQRLQDLHRLRRGN